MLLGNLEETSKRPDFILQVQLVGFFDDPEEAARAYDRAAIEYRGDKAVTNFPRESYAAEAPTQEQATPENGASHEVCTENLAAANLVSIGSKCSRFLFAFLEASNPVHKLMSYHENYWR